MIISMKRTSLLAICGLVSSVLFAQKDEVPKGWHMMDKATTGYYGLSVDKAYQFVKTKKLKSKTVIVAVIDSGIDTLHEDLKAVLWKNPKEIPGNGIDDDKNGYVDDIYGWNFLGGRDGQNVEQDSYEAARVYHKYKSKYSGKDIDPSSLSKDERFEYEMWKRSENEIAGDSKDSGLELIFLKRAYTNCLKADSILRKAMQKEKFTGKELGDYNPTDSEVKKAKNNLFSLMSGNDAMESTNEEFLEGFGDYVNGEEKKAEAGNTPPKTYRADVVKDNYSDFNDKFYGNNDVMVSNKSALHGTHVSGIIAASRSNGKGMDGVADNVKIMSLRAVPDGDEHDKDIALAIRYAVDNGAHVINMSFGKSFSPEKKWVDEAVKYAESKGVLMVHAAGNDAKNLDTTFNYPTPQLLDGTKPNNWITVGASGDPKAGGLTANFSNYGKNEVDVFAPGVKIYSTVPGGDTYQNLQGTSMASPVVAGLAAFILEYYPNLSAAQVKMVIEKSSQKPADKVKNPGNDEMVPLTDLSRAGGVVNAFEAIKLASTIKGERNTAPVKPIKSTVKPKTKG
ncbi:MAG: S8 family peptidase [Chitinophagaceae bacterium]|jgi:subtilisin family serine protease|nr:S8 family peptidase [Chitinophagaceae bacterium]MBK9463289.1 S8 family peptidase [Chitinophagaceae bacterium]MBK9659584.1 S8 family peptidase [Chitinophagaceae bacterium]MBK9936879.1 S8 family peptidase [Chitinophagaceae bacterium]MBL0068560.1 S8 family peptidase [Chitinophagaceae bacterium]